MSLRSSKSVRSSAVESLKREFALRFGGEPAIFHAPGRVNLIGEHTDYNDGFVMPLSLGASTFIGICPRQDRTVQVHSLNLRQSAEFDLNSNGTYEARHWSNHIRGVARVLISEGVPVPGADMVINSEVPVGVGLSSSAALEVACAFGFLHCAEVFKPKLEIAKACQRAEHEYAGSLCGIVDQYSACFGETGKALFLDCRSLTHEALRLPPSVRVVVCDCKVRHEIAASEYNRRRKECEEGVRILGENDVVKRHALRDFTFEELEVPRIDMPASIYRRCRHVITENQRVIDAASAMRRGDLAAFGKLMYESHDSLRSDFVVSCEELDQLVEFARKVPGVYGARLMGGGFGGCTVNLVDAAHVGKFEARIKSEYEREKGFEPDIYIASPAAAAA
jgi:galactokinase